MSTAVGKAVSDSRTQQFQTVMPSHLNVAGRLFGGQLMAWIDIVAGIVAWRHTGAVCTTASVDYLSFQRPIYPPAILILEGQITYVGTSSMEIRVDTYEERPEGGNILTNQAYLTYVAIDGDGHPLPVPRLRLETEEEEREWEAGARRAELRRMRRAETTIIKGVD